MNGETQLRARRTRIKILRAIADKRGAARFSDIRNSTGLSTGSIYYHLERMADYVGKNSKEYTLTEQGFRFLQEIDHSYVDTRPERISVPQKVTEEQIPSKVSIGRQSLKEYIWIIPYAAIVVVIVSVLQVNSALGLPGLDLDKMIANASLISSLSITGILTAAFLIMFRRQIIPGGVKGLTFSALIVLSVVIVNILVFSGLGAQVTMNQVVY
ncbi:MAG: winged helix-turn-helix domain-containing protein [Nitrososphaeraceae archaeon]